MGSINSCVQLPVNRCPCAVWGGVAWRSGGARGGRFYGFFQANDLERMPLLAT